MTGELRDLEPHDADEVVSVLTDAFRDYPVIRFVLGSEAGKDAAGSRASGGDPDPVETLVRLFVTARVMRGEPLFGVASGGRLMAAAIASFPDGGPPPPAFLAYRAAVWSALGAEAEARYDAYGRATRSFDPGVPHVHLNMVGVRRGAQRRGLGRILIDRVGRLSLARPGSEGVSLTTEDPANVPYNRGIGFDLVGHARVAPGLESWGFFRRGPAG